MDTMTEDLNEEILNELECPVCLEYMTPPITLICTNGHNMCNSCASKVQECPTCRSSVVRIRNVALENIARKVQYYCTYRKWGCNEAYRLELISKHQAVCSKVPRDCPFASPSPMNCSWKGPTDSIKNHFTVTHKREVITVPDEEKIDLYIELNKSVEGISLEKVIITYEEMFYLRSGIDAGNFYSIVRHVDDEKASPKFKYEFTLSNKHENLSIVINTVSCSITECDNDIRKSGKCVLIPLNVLKYYGKYGPVYLCLYCIKISKITE